MIEPKPWWVMFRDVAVGGAAIIGSVAIPLAGLEAADRQHQQQLARQYVELGVDILKAPDASKKPELTAWAIRIVNANGQIPLSPEAARQLSTTKIPVAVACVTEPGPPPRLPDTKAALAGAPDIAERVKLLLAGRALRNARIAELEASVAGCR